MLINIFSDYKIKFIYKGCHISQEDSTPGDLYFAHDEYEKEEIINGGKFMEMIGKYLMNDKIITYFCDKGFIKIENFDPLSGEGNDIVIVFEELEKSDK